jgi:hypothetical protein
LLASLVGIRGVVLGDEDKIITSAELVIVASGALLLPNGCVYGVSSLIFS